MLNAVDVRGLTVVRGGRVILDDLSLVIQSGAVVGLLGPSGSGKTTLIRCIVGVQKVRAGGVEVLGHPAGSAQVRGRVGYVTQAPSVYRDLTVRENLDYFAVTVGAGPQRVDEVISEVSLAEHARSRVDQLSGGEQARVSLATALLGNPELLVLDEPTVGLDPLLREELWALFHRLAEAGATLVVSSHVMDEAERCQRLILLREGRVLADDAPAGLLARTHADRLDGAFLALIRDGVPAA